LDGQLNNNGMKKLMLIILVMTTFLSCTKDDAELMNTSLIGNWNWIESSGGIDGRIETPNSTGNTIRIQITNTNIKKYVNGNLESNLNYSIYIGEVIEGGSREIILYEDEWKQSVYLSGNQLTLIDQCSDCFHNKYEKE